MLGSSYAGIAFQGSEKSLHKVLTLYRADKEHPMGHKGIEIAFEIDKNNQLLGWLIFQMDMDMMKEVYVIDEEGFKKYQIAGLKLSKGYGTALSYLGLGRTRQINIKNIFVDRPHKTGTVYSSVAGPTQSMPCSFPSGVYFAETFFDFIIIIMPLGGLRMGRFQRCSRRLFAGRCT